VFGRIGRRVEMGPHWRTSDASRGDPGRCEHRCHGGIDAAEAQQATAVSCVVAMLLRGRFALVGATIGAAEAIDRVQGREDDQDRYCQQPSHDLIIACF
jgi:hypothetical protein